MSTFIQIVLWWLGISFVVLLAMCWCQYARHLREQQQRERRP